MRSGEKDVEPLRAVVCVLFVTNSDLVRTVSPSFSSHTSIIRADAKKLCPNRNNYSFSCCILLLLG